MDWEVLIPILMFLFPLVVALLDKRAKKRKGIPPVKSAPVFPPRPAERPAAQPAQPFDWTLPTPSGRPTETVSKTQEADLSPVEGQRAVVRHAERAEEQEAQPKLEIDKKKLILYSEILKPKFDA